MKNSTNSTTTGAEGDSSELIITKTTICMLVLAVSLIENILVLVVLKKYFRKRLQRTANTYFIANMSVSDVLFAVQNLPLAYNNLVLNGHWGLQGSIGMVLCKIDMFFSLISMVTTNLTILAIAVDRFLVVYVPYKKIITRRVCFFIILLTWFSSTMFASPMLYYTDLKRQTELHTICTPPVKQVNLWYIVLAGILATTLVAMLVLYTAIGVKLWRRRKFSGNLSQATYARRQKRNRDIFKMLVTLIVVFYVCYLPVLVLSLSHYIGFYSVLKKKHGRFIAVVMMFMNGAINPIIYYIFNESFRYGVKAALAKCGCCRGAAYAVDIPMAVGRERGARKPTPRTLHKL